MSNVNSLPPVGDDDRDADALVVADVTTDDENARTIDPDINPDLIDRAEADRLAADEDRES
ncbi:hypothetical protein AB1K54_00315 [Microbacterium sp. BWT-B31]|uniref:hypothetical protein n=1 Tax=Microbacterium sp. BWT-B31 TaxID=3232072 RepID=UPI003529A49E